MDFFKRVFTRKRISSDDTLERPPMVEMVEDNKGSKYSSDDLQNIFARDIVNSTIIQKIEKQYHTGPPDQIINKEVDIIRKSRFYAEFDTGRFSLALARRLVEGELSSGSEVVRSWGIAWCCRLLAVADLDKAEEYLKVSKTLGNCPEIEIADAFIHSQRGDKHTALRILAGLSSPSSHSASIMIISHHDGPQATVAWIETAGLNVADLDSDGKRFLMTLFLQLEKWDSARSCLGVITDGDLRQTPTLNQIIAITNLISAIPEELRTVVLNQVPFHAAMFPLADDAAAIDERRIAHHYFINATKDALQFGCSSSAKIYDEFALWLELRDPSQSKQGRERIKEKLRDPQSALRLVRLGLQFGFNLDLELVEGEIERQIALNSGITQDAAIARLALAFTYKNPEDVANYIARYRDELVKHIDRKYLQFLEIDMLTQAGMPERASECLNIFMKEGLSEAETNHLRRIIAETKGTNSIGIYKEQFKNTDALNDLMILVQELERACEWDELCEYAEIAFLRTRSMREAERLAIALNNTQKYERLVEFFKVNSEFLAQSTDLAILYCWALYNEGALLEAQSQLSKLTGPLDNPNYRTLLVNIGISSGNWNSLTAYVANEFSEKDKRSALELMSAAQLAYYLGSPYAKELTHAAAKKGNDDARILAAAYSLATRAGWEGDVEASQWLNKAAVLSGNDGPIQRKSLKDVLDMKPDWDRRESETLQLLSRGAIPLFVAGESLNKSLIHMMLFPALANLSENDPRRRAIVPAYSGNRQSTEVTTLGTVAMDATVLLTLSFLRLLDKALDAYSTVYIPFSTLKWLFEEKQKASFHQPSQIRDAHQLQRMLAQGVIEKLTPKTVPDSELSAQVGDVMALLIAEAKKASEGDTQCIVVRPYPVHRIASLMEEEADLTEYADILSSCQAVVDKLRSKGVITAEEKKKTCSYLQLHEKPWPNQPEIADRAILYFDDLTTTYFLHLGLIEKLKAAGFRIIASPRELSEANQLTSYECISDKINDAIEEIRRVTNLRIQSGKVKVGRRRNYEELDTKSISEHPTLEIIALTIDCEAIFVDDRCLNRHANMVHGGKQASVFSTLDILETLVSTGGISTEDLLEYRTLLRRAGYIFIPISDYELTHHLNASIVRDNKVIETAELKAIREYILRVRMSTFLQLPQEAPWLDSLLKTFIRVLRGLWQSETDLSDIRIRSNWILKQIDVRGWAHCFGNEAQESIDMTVCGAFIMLLLLPLNNASREIQEEYWNWAEEMVLAPTKEEYPELHSWIIKRYRTQIAHYTDMDLPEEGTI